MVSHRIPQFDLDAWVEPPLCCPVLLHFRAQDENEFLIVGSVSLIKISGIFRTEESLQGHLFIRG